MYHLYILQCKDSSLYTGITTDVQRRLQEHKVGKGAKYTRAKGVEKIVYQEKCGTRSEALKREIEIKKLTKVKKLELIKNKK